MGIECKVCVLNQVSRSLLVTDDDDAFCDNVC